jgi:hypothetical protein
MKKVVRKSSRRKVAEKEAPSNPKPITIDLVKSLMLDDVVSRRFTKWPLVDYFELKQLYADYNHKYTNLDPDFVLLDGSQQYRTDKLDSMTTRANAIKYLEKHFPDLEYLIQHFPICAAGGAIFKALYQNRRVADIDMFFYNTSETDANTKLIEIMRYFEHKHQSQATFERSQNVTTVYVQRDGDATKYQFIHRIYPSKDTIIGGFDLGCSAVLYDGEFRATKLGAFCVATKMNILDITRRSTSYEHRLTKYYEYGANILVVSTTVSKLTTLYGERMYELQKKTKISDGLLFAKVDSRKHFVLTRIGGGNIQQWKANTELKNHDKSDYEADEYGNRNYPIGNAKFAIQNRVDYIVWRGKNVDEVLNPELKWKVPSAVLNKACVKIGANIFDVFETFDFITGQWRTAGNLDRVKFWYGPEYITIADKLGVIYDKSGIHRYADISKDNIIDVRTLVNKAHEILKARIEHEVLKAGAIQWITKNPGRQWTSSIHPIMTNPRLYFNPAIYVPFIIGVPEPVETLLRLCTKHKVGPFQYLNRDTLTMILARYSR